MMAEHSTIDLAHAFGGADRVVVSDNLNRTLATRSGPKAVRRVLDALGDITDGWRVPDDGVPVAKLRLNFRCDNAPIGNLAVGRRFLVAHVFGTFLVRESDEDTMQRLLDTVGGAKLLERPKW